MHPLDRTTRRIAGAAALDLPVLLTVTAARGANRVVDGHFETGAFAPEWIRTANSVFTNVRKSGDPVGAVACVVHGGDYAMTFGQSGSPATSTQTIATVVDDEYQVLLFLRNENSDGSGTETFDVLWDGVTASRATPRTGGCRWSAWWPLTALRTGTLPADGPAVDAAVGSNLATMQNPGASS